MLTQSEFQGFLTGLAQLMAMVWRIFVTQLKKYCSESPPGVYFFSSFKLFFNHSGPEKMRKILKSIFRSYVEAFKHVPPGAMS